ncbi:redoxin family protein [Colwellia psychrerythraea]|uniref:Redoxin domain protein n=1 Tax=Colwellia psychrerythraea TaxID=28229 RepID=A0A099KQ17_COLPS|nr:redoxin family protein [Colwellia psychrerythraea]KGJ91723.1 Redoxin domain protein [Colwellia psychrerythraea]
MISEKFKAGDLFPKIKLNTLTGIEVEIGKPTQGKDWQMVVVYRGKHCPMCTNYMKQLEQLKDKFYHLGIDIIAVSADDESKALAHNQEMILSFPVAYGLSIEQMKQLGLYISNPRSPKETDIPFAEPGIYVINEQGQVQVTDISNAPFARPDLETLAGGLTFIRNPENNYPIRGKFEQ